MQQKFVLHPGLYQLVISRTLGAVAQDVLLVITGAYPVETVLFGDDGPVPVKRLVIDTYRPDMPVAPPGNGKRSVLVNEPLLRFVGFVSDQGQSGRP